MLNTEVNIFDGKNPNEYIVHLPLLGKAFKADTNARWLIEKLKNGHQLTSDELDSQAYQKIASLNLIGDGIYIEPRISEIINFEPIEGTLIFTETCNMGCQYCYASASPVKSNPMPFSIATAAVNTVLANATRTKERFASFRYIGGGEPTIEWELLKQVSEYIAFEAKRLNVQFFIRLITNGTLLNEDRVDWLADNIHFITLSFDILPELQKNRPFANGKSTQEKLIKVCKSLRKKGVNFHLRTTITADGAGKLTEMIKYNHNFIGADSIRFEPLSEVGRAVDYQLNKPVQEIFVEEFKKAYVMGEQLGIKVSCKMTKNIERKSSRFCETEFSVSPNGAVSACHRYSREDQIGYDLFHYGQLEDGKFIFDTKKLNNVRMIDVHQFDECQNCIAKWNCAGGCLSSRVNQKGISQSGPLCYLTRELLKFSIINELEK